MNVKQKLLTVVLLFLCIAVFSLQASADCVDGCSEYSGKEFDDCVSKCENKKWTKETCDITLGTYYKQEEIHKFGKRAGEAINDRCDEAGSWNDCVEKSWYSVSLIFEQAVQGAGAHEDCIDLLTDEFFRQMKTQVGAQFGFGDSSPDSIRGFGESMCEAGIRGDAEAMIDLILHPTAMDAMQQMMNSLAEEFGEETNIDIRDEMRKEFSEKKLEACEVTGSWEKDCEEPVIAGYEKMGLKPENCGILRIKAQPQGEAMYEDEVPVVKLDGKWYLNMGDEWDSGIEDMKIYEDESSDSSTLTYEYCDRILTDYFTGEEALEYGARAGDIVNEKCVEAVSWDDCVEKSWNAVSWIFDEAVQIAGADQACAEIIMDAFFGVMETQVGDMYDNQ